MKRLAFLAVATMFAMIVACGLNPQPFPPDNPDGSIDASKGGTDANAFGDVGASNDAAADSEPGPESDSGQDAEASDASDGSLDTGDAATDADDDGSALDATLD